MSGRRLNASLFWEWKINDPSYGERRRYGENGDWGRDDSMEEAHFGRKCPICWGFDYCYKMEVVYVPAIASLLPFQRSPGEDLGEGFSA